MSDVLALWRDVVDRLDREQPLPDDVRAYLLEVAQRLSVLAIDERLSPEQAARLIPEAIGITGKTIREYRAKKTTDWIGGLFWAERVQQPDAKVEALAADIGQMFGVSARRVFRAGVLAAKRIEKLIASRS